jgi:hypothetical protein
MSTAKVESKMIPMLVAVSDKLGTIVRYEWQEVTGCELELGGVELKSGETLVIEHPLNTGTE